MFYIPTLTIAGSDCSGGAGIQADIKTMSALGCYAASVVTSVTVQNTCGVTAVHAVPADIVGAQIDAVMTDIRPLAVKVGMVNDAPTIHAIAEALRKYPDTPVVIDPVMVSSSGTRLMRDDALKVFVSELMPLATLLTPNLPEAEVLSGMKIDHKTDLNILAQVILARPCMALLLKGGHAEGNMKTDRLYLNDTGGELFVQQFTAPAVASRNTHGTGCTLSSAICSFLAMMQGDESLQSEPLNRRLGFAVSRAKDYLTEALKSGSDVKIGQGTGPVNHFFAPKPLIKKKSLNFK